MFTSDNDFDFVQQTVTACQCQRSVTPLMTANNAIDLIGIRFGEKKLQILIIYISSYKAESLKKKLVLIKDLHNNDLTFRV